MPSPPRGRFAAIDVGSNGIRLRVIEATRDGSGALSVRELVNQRAAVRLGTEVYLTGRLPPASISQASGVLRGFRQVLDEQKVDGYRATATSAVREAKNGATLVERARREAGIELDVIEGIEEARLIELAVSRKIDLAKRVALLVDVGGGSTELTVLDDGKHAFSVSLPLGTVRVLETVLAGGSSLKEAHVRLLRETIDRALVEAIAPLGRFDVEMLIGTGGNIDTLADLCPQMGGAFGFDRAVDVAAARALFGKLVKLSPGERKDAYGLRPDRADTILPASAIFLRLAEHFEVPAILAPGVGLKEGILTELSERFFHLWDESREAQSVIAACERLGQRYQFDEAHGQLVAKLAVQLFDDLRSVHGFRDRDRLLLRAAALLHDIGDFVRYDGHHKHSYYLILHSDIIGLTPLEREVVANIARYHRKSPPDASHPNFRELDKDAKGRVRGLAAILRVADALDREHLGKVKSVRGSIDAKGRLVLAVDGAEDRELEEWTVRAKSGLLRDVFDLDVTFG